MCVYGRWKEDVISSMIKQEKKVSKVVAFYIGKEKQIFPLSVNADIDTHCRFRRTRVAVSFSHRKYNSSNIQVTFSNMMLKYK